MIEFNKLTTKGDTPIKKLKLISPRTLTVLSLQLQ
jgi:hypothetical protein